MSTPKDPSRLELSLEEMRSLGYRIVDSLAQHYACLDEKPVTRVATRAQLEASLAEPPPESGMNPHDVVDLLEREVFSNIMLTNHARFFAFVPGPSNFVGAMADALAAGFNPIVTDWVEASGPAQIELITIDWLRQLCGFPESGGGLFVSGGSVANLTALATARHIKLGDDMHRAVLYCSNQTHASNRKALQVLGFAAEHLREVASDTAYRLDAEALESCINEDRKAGKRPFCVIANAGTTNTGAVDPLPDLSRVCRQHDLWLHVDGAYGAAAVLSEKGRAALSGLHLADSLAIDPHKWLFQPFEIGCVLVREAGWLKQSFGVAHEYMQDVDTDESEREVNFCDYGIQLSRGFRALKLWMSIKVFGLKAFADAIERCIDNAEYAERLLRDEPHFELLTPAQLGVVTFRYAPTSMAKRESDILNLRIVQGAIEDGYAMLSSTRLEGRTVLRLCTINPRTTRSDLEGTIAMLERLGNSALEALRLE